MADQPDNVMLDTFAGLRNTVLPERLGQRELARARNVDIDDAGQVHRRRGQTMVATGAWHSLYGTTYKGTHYMFGVNAGVLVLVGPNYSSTPLLDNMPLDPLAWERVDDMVYFSNLKVSGKISLYTGVVSPWGSRHDHSYTPSTLPTVNADFWLSPVTDPDADNPPVAGKLLGPVPLAKYLAYFNGRMYLATGNVLWATELYLYNFVDKTSGYRQFEDEITGIACVEDGMFVGTKSALYFVSGMFMEQRRITKVSSGVVPGTMIHVQGELVDPTGRQRPDVPQEAMTAISCMTGLGLVVGMKGGQVYNLTQSNFRFPEAVEGRSYFRRADGYSSIVTTLDSGGDPTISDAAFGDYVEATLIRNGQVIEPTPTFATDPPANSTPDIIRFKTLSGKVVGTVYE